MKLTEQPLIRTTLARFAAFAALMSSLSLNAAPALDFSLSGAHLENQSVTGTLGWEFSVNQAITITHLGLFDLGQDGLAESHAIGIWNVTGGNPLFQATIPAGNATSLDGKFRYVQIPDTILQPGNYVIGAQYFGVSADSRVSEATGITTDPSITYLGGRYEIGSNLPFPNTPSGSGHYFGPNFQVVPEPSSIALFSIGGLVLATGLIRKQKTGARKVGNHVGE